MNKFGGYAYSRQQKMSKWSEDVCLQLHAPKSIAPDHRITVLNFNSVSMWHGEWFILYKYHGYALSYETPSYPCTSSRPMLSAIAPIFAFKSITSARSNVKSSSPFSCASVHVRFPLYCPPPSSVDTRRLCGPTVER